VERSALLGGRQTSLEVGPAPAAAREVIELVVIGPARDGDDLQPLAVDDAAHQRRARSGRVPHCPGDPVDVIAASVDTFTREFIPAAGASTTLGSLPHR
jgi:hypothetical protein